MTNDYEKSGMPPFIDEAKYLLSEHPSLRRRDLTPEEIATSVVDMLETYAGVDLTDEQRSDAALVIRTLPEDDASMERWRSFSGSLRSSLLLE